MRRYFQQLEKIIQRDPAPSRGIKNLIIPNQLEKAVYNLIAKKNVFIVSGFAPNPELAMCETDGPLGTFSLAHALLNKHVEGEEEPCSVKIITDEVSAPVFDQGCKTFEKLTGKALELTVVPSDHPEYLTWFLRGLCVEHLPPKTAVDCIVALERAGMASDKQIYNFRGNNLQHHTKLDQLFDKKIMSNDHLTIGIGDGGNEMGMGTVYEQIKKHVNNGDKIACITPADILLTCGVSNYGGYALAKGISLCTNEYCQTNINFDRRILEDIVSIGAIDGVSLKAELSVDGRNYDREIVPIIEEINQVGMSKVENL